MHPLHHVGNVQLIAVVEARDPLAVLVFQAAGAPLRTCPSPCPTCQQTISVTVSGPLTIVPRSCLSVDIFIPAGLGSAQTLASRKGRFNRARPSSVYGPYLDVRHFCCVTRPFSSLGPDHQLVLRPEGSTPSSSWKPAAVHSWMARPRELAGLVEHAPHRAFPSHDPATWTHRRPPFTAARAPRTRERRVVGRLYARCATPAPRP